jgi:hypothetical protein
MIADETLGRTIAVLLMAATLYTAFRAAAEPGPAARVGRTLHALMTAAMALMLLPGGHWPLLPQFLLFALGAWWFVLQAVARRTRHGDPLPGTGRAKPLYDAAAMAAMAFMLALGGFRDATLPGVLGPAPAAHHASAVAVPLAVPAPGWSAQPGPLPGTLQAAAVGLAVAFGLAAVLWAARLLVRLPVQLRAPLRPKFRNPRVPGTHHGSSVASPGRSSGFRDVADAAVEVLGAAAFAVMFAALAG